VTPFSLPDLINRAADIIGEHKLIVYLLFPWIPTVQLLMSKQLVLTSWNILAALSEDVRRHTLRMANQWGIGHIVQDTLLRIRPCAVKVLPCDSSHGAYGSRSAENEVLSLVCNLHMIVAQPQYKHDSKCMFLAAAFCFVLTAHVTCGVVLLYFMGR
jgi:hypothetical protein